MSHDYKSTNSGNNINNNGNLNSNPNNGRYYKDDPSRRSRKYYPLSHNYNSYSSYSSNPNPFPSNSDPQQQIHKHQQSSLQNNNQSNSYTSRRNDSLINDLQQQSSLSNISLGINNYNNINNNTINNSNTTTNNNNNWYNSQFKRSNSYRSNRPSISNSNSNLNLNLKRNLSNSYRDDLILQQNHRYNDYNNYLDPYQQHDNYSNHKKINFNKSKYINNNNIINNDKDVSSYRQNYKNLSLSCNSISNKKSLIDSKTKLIDKSIPLNNKNEGHDLIINNKNDEIKNNFSLNDESINNDNNLINKKIEKDDLENKLIDNNIKINNSIIKSENELSKVDEIINKSSDDLSKINNEDNKLNKLINNSNNEIVNNDNDISDDEFSDIKGCIFPMLKNQYRAWDLKHKSKKERRKNLKYLNKSKLQNISQYNFLEKSLLIFKQADSFLLFNALKQNLLINENKNLNLINHYIYSNDLWKNDISFYDKQLEKIYEKNNNDEKNQKLQPIQNQQQQQQQKPISSRRSRHHGDSVRTEAEFMEILASLEQERERDPLIRAQYGAAIIPDMIIDPIEKFAMNRKIDSNNLIENKNKWANRILTDPIDNFTENEHNKFCEFYTIHPKKFGRISHEMGGLRTAEECVLHYYKTKKSTNYKQLIANKNKKSKKKSNKKKKDSKSNNNTVSPDTSNIEIENLNNDLKKNIENEDGNEDDFNHNEHEHEKENGDGDGNEHEHEKENEDGNRDGDGNEHEHEHEKENEDGNENRISNHNETKIESSDNHNEIKIEFNDNDNNKNDDDFNKKKRFPENDDEFLQNKKIKPSTNINTDNTKSEIQESNKILDVNNKVSSSINLEDQQNNADISNSLSHTSDMTDTIVDDNIVKHDGVESDQLNDDFNKKNKKNKKKDEEKSHISSYWSVQDINHFPNLLQKFGSRWEDIADELGTKSATMVKNYYQRGLVDHPDWQSYLSINKPKQISQFNESNNELNNNEDNSYNKNDNNNITNLSTSVAPTITNSNSLQQNDQNTMPVQQLPPSMGYFFKPSTSYAANFPRVQQIIPISNQHPVHISNNEINNLQQVPHFVPISENSQLYTPYTTDINGSIHLQQNSTASQLISNSNGMPVTSTRNAMMNMSSLLNVNTSSSLPPPPTISSTSTISQSTTPLPTNNLQMRTLNVPYNIIQSNEPPMPSFNRGPSLMNLLNKEDSSKNTSNSSTNEQYRATPFKPNISNIMNSPMKQDFQSPVTSLPMYQQPQPLQKLPLPQFQQQQQQKQQIQMSLPPQASSPQPQEQKRGTFVGGTSALDALARIAFERK